jgi:hypothetical protein
VCGVSCIWNGMQVHERVACIIFGIIMQISQNGMNMQRTDDRCDCTRMHGKATASHAEPWVSIGHESMNVGGPQQSWHA